MSARPRSRPKRKAAIPHWPLQTYLPLSQEGRHFDLGAIFRKLNHRYFRRTPLRGYRIEWGRRRRLRPMTTMIFGTIQEQDRVIRIHPLLDAAFVPQWFLEYVVYHEMLHAVVKDRTLPSGRRVVHTEEFLERESRLPQFRRAVRWERENLLRFLR